MILQIIVMIVYDLINVCVDVTSVEHIFDDDNVHTKYNLARKW